MNPLFAKSALSRKGVCPKCDGMKYVNYPAGDTKPFEKGKCSECNGTGRDPDYDDVKERLLKAKAQGFVYYNLATGTFLGGPIGSRQTDQNIRLVNDLLGWRTGE